MYCLDVLGLRFTKVCRTINVMAIHPTAVEMTFSLDHSDSASAYVTHQTLDSDNQTIQSAVF